MRFVSLRSGALSLAGALVLGGCAASAPQAPRASGPVATVTTAAPVPKTLDVTLEEFKVVASRVAVPAGHYSFTIHNTGTMPHELLVFHPTVAPKDMAMKDGDIDEESAGANLVSDGDNIDPAGSQTRDVDLSTPGTYVLMCNIPQHFMQGMALSISVT